jgi:hypothetical protein
MATQTITSSLNGELFKTYVKECLVPTLRVDDIVVMDNLSTHKVGDLLRAIGAGLSLITAQNCAAWVEHAGYFL